MESNTGFDMTMENSAAEPLENTRATEPGAGEQPISAPGDKAVEGEKAEEKHRIKYNGEIKELTLDELKIAAQKGMNYDKVVSERDRLRASREFSVLDSRAAAEGLTRAQFLDRLESERDGAEEAALVEKGMPSELAREHVRLKKEADRARDARMASLAAEKREEEIKRKVSEFQKLYPDVTHLPEDVVADIRNGTDLIVAYQKHEISRLKNSVAAGEQNGKNREKAVGSLGDTGASGGSYYSEAELDSLLKNGGDRLMDDDVWEKAVRSMAFHQKKKKG
ncbi:MAG: hypothetical protein IJY86_12575 [Clostridia bacterium]|nr:hypothetical protein [Clostridia bacterium]